MEERREVVLSKNILSLERLLLLSLLLLAFCTQPVLAEFEGGGRGARVRGEGDGGQRLREWSVV